MEHNREEHQSQNIRRRTPGYVRRPIIYIQQRFVEPDVASVTTPWSTRISQFVKMKLRSVRSTLQVLALSRKWQAASLVVVAIVVLVSEFIPTLTMRSQQVSYDVSAISKLIEPTSKELQAKLQYNAKQKAWLFNENAAQQLPGMSNDAAKLGGLTYSAQLPTDLNGAEGLKLTDAQGKLDISFKPEFKLGQGRVDQGYATYPIHGTKSQLIYTFKHEGVKEDIVLYQAPGDTEEYSYKLQLPKGMEARLQQDGSVGIFGGDQNLFGNISYGSDKDRELVEKARSNSKKNHLYYIIPAPIITGDNSKKANAKFDLDKDTLTVRVKGLAQASYPLSIDPSFVMDTSGNCSWQKTGNNEDNINYSGCKIGRNSLSGGTVGNWTASTSAATGNMPVTSFSGFVASNGYLYAFGSGQATSYTLVYYAPINASTGALGQFVRTTDTLDDRRGTFGMVINGYLYAFGGININKTTEFAKINADGSVGAWAYTSSTTAGHSGGGAAYYNGRVYLWTGCGSMLFACTSNTAVAEYATVRGDGTLSSWTSSTSLATGQYPDPAIWVSYGAANGYLYSVGGTGTATTVYYAPINSNGSIGAWAASGAVVPASVRGATVSIANGYLYVMGGEVSGNATNSVYLAKIYASGKLGPLQQTTSFTTARVLLVSTVYNGRIYMTGGSNQIGNGATEYLDTQFTTVSTTLGTTGSYSPVATYETQSRISFATVVYGGYMYIIGGTTSNSGGRSSMLNTVRYAAFNPDGSMGSWTTSTTKFNNVNGGTGSQTCTSNTICPGRVNMAAAATGGYLYIAGGVSNGSVDQWSDVQAAPLDAVTGAPGTWSTLTADYLTNSASTYTEANGRSQVAMEIYNGYIYLIGGHNSTGGVNGTDYSHIYYAQITGPGTLGSFNTTVSLPSVRAGVKTFVNNGKLYIVGGGAGQGWAFTAFNSDPNDVQFIPINSNGTLDGATGWKDANAASNGGSGSSFAATNTLIDYGVSFDKGYLYITGGASGLGTTNVYAAVYAAKLNANGSLGSWSTLTSISNNRFGQGSVVYNSYLYTIGGCSQRASLIGQSCSNDTTAVYTDYQYAQIYNGGGGKDGAWTAGPNITGKVWASAIVATGGYLYVMGGCTGFVAILATCSSRTAATYYAPLNSDGSLGAWQTGTSIHDSVFGGSAIASNGYMYTFGGCTVNTCSTSINGVYSALICTGTNTTGGCTISSTPGTFGTWNTLPTFTTARWGAGVAIANGYVYLAGGTPGAAGAALNDVQSAQIQPNGGLGSWGSVGTGSTLALNRYTAPLVAYGNYLYITAGADTGGNRLYDMQYAQVGTNGTLGAWQSTSAPPISAGMNAVAYNGYMYILGSLSGGTTATNQLSYAPIFSNGILGTWRTTAGYSAGTIESGGAATIYNGYVYKVGGIDSGYTIGQDTAYAPLQVTSNTARYSVLFTTDKTTNPANFFTTVSSQTMGSKVNVGFASGVNAASPALSGVTTTSSVATGVKYALSISGDGVMYYWLPITLDDSQSMTYGETSGSNMSYLQLNYHPNPSMRLRGGKTFNSGAQQSLDAP